MKNSKIIQNFKSIIDKKKELYEKMKQFMDLKNLIQKDEKENGKNKKEV